MNISRILALTAALVPPMAAAFVLVAYFNWRERLRNHMLGDHVRDELASAA
jgi:hypothetical protein